LPFACSFVFEAHFILDMFPAKMAQKKNGTPAPKNAPKKAPEPTKKYEKIKGTEIKQMKGGIVVRVCQKSGVQFPPEATKKVRSHLVKIGENPGGPQGKKKGPKPPKEYTPEQLAAKKKKDMERAAKVVAKENRKLVSNKYYKGECVEFCGIHAWVKPSNMKDIPFEVDKKIQAMNNELRQKNTKGKGFLDGSQDLVIYVRVSDVQKDKFLKKGVMCQFQLYTDSKGVGGCQVKP